MLRRNRPQSGYSLIELLVTLLIAAALLGLLLPALQQARAAADNTQCLANKANNGRSMLMYTFDRDGRFPPLFHGFSPGQSGKIMIRVHPRTPRDSGLEYMDEASLVCPSDQEQGTVPVRRGNGVSHQLMSYGYNVELSIKRLVLDGLSHPSRMAVLFDGSMSGPGRGKNVEGMYNNSYEFVAAALTARHTEDMNVLFADWHAQTVHWIEPEQVLRP